MGHTTVLKMDKKYLESSETNFMKLPPYVFDVDHVTKVRSELSITALEKKMNKITAEKSGLMNIF